MKTWTLILFLLVIVLFLWRSREGFETPSCPAGYIEDRKTSEGTPYASLRCKKEVGEPKCPDGYSMIPFVAVPGSGGGTGGICEKGTDTMPPQCPENTYINVINDKQVCVEYSFVRLTPPGSTTGGSSDTFSGPTTRRSMGRGIFGPGSGGFGQGSTGNTPLRDSTKTTNYPELLGGGDSKPRTLVDGAGLVDPSKNWQLANNGSLPNCTSLGCDENSRYLPYSRQPGDMDLIPDPYRVSQQYMSSSYSFKTEPTPFLTDFSAFLR